MEYSEAVLDKASVHVGDLPVSAVEGASRTRLIAWDIETSGLSWRDDQIGTCQVYVPDSHVYIVRLNDKPRPHLEKLLSDSSVCKVFHHAMFDLRFMVYQWSVEAQNIVCTKIASKILNPSTKDHSLKNILQHHLKTYIDKNSQNSDWFKKHLTQEQLAYAANDVLYLPELFQVLHQKLLACGRWSLAEKCFDFLPVQVHLEILGWVNVFQY